MTTLRSILSSLLVATLSVSVGCVDAEEGDGIDDSFSSDGKADAFGVSEGSVDAMGVLYLVNTASLEQLDDAAGLSSAAAKAIIRHRQGGDAKDQTADDDAIADLTELDAIPYVGPIAFRLLVDEARATGLVPSSDPFDPSFCKSDWAVTSGDLRAALPAGSTSVVMPKFTGGVRMRHRVCVTPDNCPAWENGAGPNMFNVTGDEAAGDTTLQIPAAGIDGNPGFGFAQEDPFAAMWASVGVGDAGTTTPLTMECFAAADADDAVVSFNQCGMALGDKPLFLTGGNGGPEKVTGSIGARCMQTVFTGGDGYTQRQIAFYARY